jgi:hypothetical protein
MARVTAVARFIRPFNRFIEETEYETLSDYEREGEAQGSDARIVAALRSRSDVVVPGSRQLLETAS